MVTRWLSAVLPTTAGEIRHRRDLTLFSKSKLEPKISVIHLQLVQEEHDGLGERARWNEEDSWRSGWDETKVTHLQDCQLSFPGENTRGWNFGRPSPRTYSWIQCSVWGNQLTNAFSFLFIPCVPFEISQNCSSFFWKDEKIFRCW